MISISPTVSEGLLDDNLIVFVPKNIYGLGIVDFVMNFLNSDSTIDERAALLSKSLPGLKHKDRNLFKTAQYGLIAYENSAMKYVCEIFHTRPHVNGEHWFIKTLLEQVEYPASSFHPVFLFISDINVHLYGRASFDDYVDFCNKLDELCSEIEDPEARKALKSINEKDFPPGYFYWSKDYRNYQALSEPNW